MTATLSLTSRPAVQAARPRRPAVAAVLIAAAATGAVAAAAFPRGPATGTEVWLLMVSTLLAGGGAGWMLRSRWAAVVAPALHLAGFELARATLFHLDGPSFGPPRFDLAMGVLLFLAVHVMYALVACGPMVLGAIVGAAMERRRSAPAATGTSARGPLSRAGLGLRRLITLALAVALGTLGVQLVRPGTVEPVTSADGRPVAGSVATLDAVRIGGVDQWVSARGRSADNPVLLHLSGGPGSSDVGWVRTFNRALEDRFTVVVWEQRGVGKSYPALDPTNRLTLDQMVSDGIELSRWLATHFDERKIYLTGNSWGSTLGVLMAQRAPELYWAYVGTGQMVSQRETDRLLYRQLRQHADRTGDTALRGRLTELGEPPYRDVLGYALVMQYYDVVEPYQHTPEFDRARGLTGFFPAEYSLLDTWNELRGFADMAGLLYPQLQQLDFRTDVPTLQVPVYFAQGRHELSARSRLADQWIAQLQAPVKRVYLFERSGHNADAEEADRFNHLMTDTVLPETYPR